jgi:hypothetical protein
VASGTFWFALVWIGVHIVPSVAWADHRGPSPEDAITAKALLVIAAVFLAGVLGTAFFTRQQGRPGRRRRRRRQ